MAPMRKVELDKAAWAWCNDVEPENITEDNIATAYRLNVIKCGFSKCRRNCRGNPFCLNGLGESKWMSDPVEELDDDDLDSECRKPESFVGLRNLGATCYINSLLQLWFHNIAFRNPILRWNPAEDPVENSAIAHLQFLFTLMQFGRKKSVDPSDFVSSLEIDVSLQQDAREFSQLFISYLEDYLKRQSDPVVGNFVNNNFQGHYNYVTRCSKCNTESIRESTFYELEVNVKGHRTLDESIAEFLKEEKLEGDDMYRCCVCQSKQEATRHIELTALPPVFNLQLIRFIYDRQKGMKKKLNTPLQFPETLDMGPYLKKNKENPVSVKYNLFAVLIHKGPSANSGHYVAHICDQTSGNWYMFNDENTQKIEGKKLKLNSDEDYEVDEDGKKQKPSKAIKGYLSSSNAYMLVYTAGNSGLDKTPIDEDSLQQHLKIKLQEYNETFDSMISQSREEKRTQLEDENLMKAEMASFLSTLPVHDNNEWEAISIKWLTNWISANRSTGFYPVDNKHFTCIHNKINPGSIKEFKFINKEVANNIYDKYDGGPRLDINSLCKECVQIICHSMRIKSKISNDQKELNNLTRLKGNIDPPAFWIGKESLRTWRNKALKMIDKPPCEINGENKTSICEKKEINGESKETNGERKTNGENNMDVDSSPSNISSQAVVTSHDLPNQSMTINQLRPEYLPHTSSIPSSSSSLAERPYRCKRKPNVSSLILPAKLLMKRLDEFSTFISERDPTLPFKSLPDHFLNSLISSTYSFYSKLQQTKIYETDFDVLVSSLDKLKKAAHTNNNDSDEKESPEKNEILKQSSPQAQDKRAVVPDNRPVTPVDQTLASLEQPGVVKDQTVVNMNIIRDSSLNCYDMNGEGSGESGQDGTSPLRKRFKAGSDEEKEKDGSEDGKMNGNKTDEDEEFGYDFNFNDDLVCIHGNLCVEESSRRLVPEQAWTIFKSYFPECREFSSETEPCLDCQCLVSEGKVAKDLHKQQATKEKELLGNLYMGKNRPKAPFQGRFNIVSIPDFLEPWRKFIREPTRRDPMTSVRNSNLVCPHDGLKYNPNQPDDLDRFILLHDDEWEKLSQNFKVDVEVRLNFREDGEIDATPEVCDECVAARIAEEQQALLQYTNAKVYIRQIRTSTEEYLCPSYNQLRKDKTAPPADGPIRRSARNKRSKVEKIFNISSDQSLLNLKLEIFNWLGVAPFDQHLFLEDGKELAEHQATLASLSVFPDSVIYLKVDEPGDESPEEGARKRPTAEPEHGFKGTGLLKR